MTPRTLPTWDEYLVTRAQAGDPVAKSMLVEAVRGLMYARACQLLREGEDAQDAVQEAMMKALRNLHRFDTARPFRPWLMRILDNVCRDIMRRRRQRAEPLESHEHTVASDENTEEVTYRGLERRQLLEAIARLPERYRAIVLMRHFDDLDIAEIAIRVGKPEGTIKSWLFRARALLRSDLVTAQT